MLDQHRPRLGRFARTATVLALTFGGVVAVEAATAAPALAACGPATYYSITSHKAYFLPAAGTWFKDGPGGTVTASVTKATTISATGTVSGGASLKLIVAEAHSEVSGSITASKTVTVGHSYLHVIAAKKYGNLQYGSWGYTVGWKYERENGNCTFTTLSTGTARMPAGAVGWRYWETSS